MLLRRLAALIPRAITAAAAILRTLFARTRLIHREQSTIDGAAVEFFDGVCSLVIVCHLDKAKSLASIPWHHSSSE